MSSIAQIYSLHGSASVGGIEGYYVEKKYCDPLKMREERAFIQSKDKPSARPTNIAKKTTFIDEVQKISAKLPGPTTYQPSIKQRQKSSSDVVKHPDRTTFIDDIAKTQKKKNVPAAGTYSKVETEVDKTKLKSNLSRAESPTYLEACMRNSLQSPGVGNYNAYRAIFDKRGSKWKKDSEKEKKSEEKVKFPPVGTYNPNPISYRLFSGISDPGSKKSLTGFGGKTERFEKSKDRKLPFYNILSEWGMKDKLQKKDILTKISTHSSKSVYY